MPGFNPETDRGDNRELISRLENRLETISRDCMEILKMITEAKQRNGSDRPSFNVNDVKNKVNKIIAAVNGFLKELEELERKISISQEISSEDISTLTAEVMTLKELLGRQEVNIDEVQAQVERVQKIANDIKNTLKRSR